ncbi:MAG TPA: hypothetical protein VII73_10625 [Caulobacteraceae bacterium]
MSGRALSALAAASVLAACAGVPGRGGPRTVSLPTPVACRPAVGPPALYPDTDAALVGAPDLFARVRLLAAGRLLRIARERELTAALAGCAAR